MAVPIGWNPRGKLLDIWVEERRHEVAGRFAACYLFLLKINGTIEQFCSVLLKQYSLCRIGAPALRAASAPSPLPLHEITSSSRPHQSWDLLLGLPIACHAPLSVLFPLFITLVPASAPEGQLIKADFLPCHPKILLGENVNRKIRTMGTGELAKTLGRRVGKVKSPPPASCSTHDRARPQWPGGTSPSEHTSCHCRAAEEF